MKNNNSSNASDSRWRQLKTSQEWEELVGLVQGLHDGVIKELHWTHGEYVNDALEMVFAGSPRLYLLVQLQLLEIPSLEFRFYGVQECTITSTKELDANLLFQTNSVRFLLSSDDENRIVAQSCEYRYSGSQLLGPGPFPCTFY